MTENPLTIRTVRPGDESAISDILIEVSEWLIGSGQALWSPADFVVAKLRPQLGSFYVAEIGDAMVGVMKLEGEDPTFWPEVPPGESLFLHKLAIRRRWAGRGLAQAMISWAVQQAVAQGCRYLRLDCAATRPQLRSVYERAGFTLHSIKELGGFTAARYQLRLRD